MRARPRVALVVAVFAVVGPVVIGRIVGEQYPFSPLSMYAVPGPRRQVVLLVDGEARPLPIVALTGVSAARLEKRLRREIQREPVGAVARTLAFLSSSAQRAGTPLPVGARLTLIELVVADGGVSERPAILEDR